MLNYAMWCLFSAVALGLLGVTGILGGAMRVARFLFLAFAVLFVASFVV